MAAILEPPENIPLSVPAATETSQSYFETVHSNLLKLGALTLEDFLRDPYQEPAPQESFLSNPLYHDAPVLPPLVVDDKDGEGKPAPTPAPIFLLHQICSQTFGSIDALNYEIIEEEGKESKCSPPHLTHRISSHCPYLPPLLLFVRKAVHPHHHTAQRCHAFVYLKASIFSQGRGARRGSGGSGRNGRD
jgi:hypothetical protein